MLRKTGSNQDLSIPRDLHPQTQTTVSSKKLLHPPSSIAQYLFQPHISPLTKLHTAQQIPWTAQSEVSQRPPCCPSQTHGDDSSHSEELDVKPVRLSSDQAGSKSSSQASSQGSAQKRKSNQSYSDEDSFSSHKSPSEVANGLKTMALISESEDAANFSYQKSKHRNRLHYKENKTKDISVSRSEDSDTDECSGKLLQTAKQSSKTMPRQKDNIFPEESSLENNDDSEDSGDINKIVQVDGKMSVQNIPKCFSVEEVDHETLATGSGSTSSTSESADEENLSLECEDNVKVCMPSKGATHEPDNSDSEDCIVSPETRSKIIYVIPENGVKLEGKNSDTSSADEDSYCSSDDNIEHVLAPQEQTQKQRESKADDESKEPAECLVMSVKNGKTNQHSDSNESDDFYD
ncbi:hypothetical protein WMY93_009315 [Mugilogobius chulae]|uniref:Uncharacterized protein n=1 Tax=Mugilogobius chulae TaxID=88201 RepID=A0AAW0PB75_9GOBI